MSRPLRPIPPAARVSGHRSGCFDSGGNYRSCVSGCEAWNDRAAQVVAHASFDHDMQRYKGELVASSCDACGAVTPGKGSDPCLACGLGVIKRCTCCSAAYGADAWQALPLVGDMKDEVEHLEMRNCPCGSTISAVVLSTDEHGTRFYEKTES